MMIDSNLSQEVLLSLLEKIPNYVFFKDRDMIYRLCNQNFAQFAGFEDCHSLVGKSDYDLPWGKTTADIYREEDRQIIETGQPILSKEVLMRIGAKDSVLFISKSPLLDEKRAVIGILGVYIDISLLKQSQQELIKEKKKAEQASEAKSEFIANMSHDLRTPITGIMGMHQGVLSLMETAQSLFHSSVSSEGIQQQLQEVMQQSQEYMQMAQTSTQALLNVFNQILDAIQMESGKLEEPPTVTFRIRDLLEQHVQLLKSVVHHKQLDLSFEVAPSVPKYLEGIQAYLERSLSNLISNALKFTHLGFVRVSVYLAEDTPQSLHTGDKVILIIRVQDSGMGIPSDQFDTIFGHFSRLTPSYQGIYPGSGLGLFMVKKYVEAMHGRIEVESQINEGSCFTLTLPLVVSEAQAMASTEASSAPSLTLSRSQKIARPVSEAQDTQARILIVEDSQMAAMAVEMILTSLGLSVDVAESGQEALKKAQSHPYNLIFMDIGLPDTTGVEVTKKIRALSDPKKAQVPIVALTGHAGNAEKRQECLGVGMQAVLNKPASKADLTLILQQYVFDMQGGDSTQSTEVPSSSTTVIDWAGCQALYEDQPEQISQLLSILADDLPSTRERITHAYQARDTQALREVLHYLRGGMCYLKVPQLEHTAGAFHDALKAEPQDTNQLEQTHAALQHAIDQFLATWKQPPKEPTDAS